MICGYGKNRRTGRAAGLIALVFFILSVFVPSMAEDSLTVSVSWPDGGGEMILRTAQPLGYEGYEDAYWVMVDPGALSSLTLQISGVVGGSVSFYPENGSVLTGVSDAGSDLAAAPWTDIVSVGEYEGNIRIRLYVSTVAEYPVLSPAATSFATVRIRYLDESNGIQLIDDGFVECALNDVTTVTAAQIPGYVPLNTSTNVFTDPNGITSPSEVVFYYRPDLGPSVTIHYRDLLGNPVSPDATVECGIDETKVIRAVRINGYTVEGNDTATVTVDAYGAADKTEIVFVYRPIEPAVVTVRYLNAVTGQDIAEPDEITCPLGETAVFRAKTFTGYVLNSGDTVEMFVGINGETDKDEIVFYYGVAETPTVRVSYLFEDGSHAAEDDFIPCPLNMETPITARNFPGYRIVGDASRTVTVDGNGRVEPESIQFVYTPSTEPVITVRYVDQSTGEDIASPATVVCAINSSTPVQAETVNGYTVTGQAIRYVYVDAQGKADTDEVVFTYAADSAPQVIWVRVSYREITDGALVFSSAEPFDAGSVITVYADMSRIPAEYELSDDPSRTVSVPQGEDTEVVFWLKKKTVTMITIPVFYMDEAGREVASPGLAELVEGNNAVYAQPFDLKSDYAPIGDSVQYVVMDETGQLNKSEVVFYYYLAVTPSPSPAPTAVPYVVAADAFYAHTTKDSVPLRSTPGAASMDNIIRYVSPGEVVYVAGALSNELGEKWYQVDVGGVGGFINANVIARMTQDEINEVFGFTPTPVPTPIPDGAPIERWGKINHRQVNFRRDSSRSAKVIDQLNTGAQVWVFRSLTVDGTQWYFIRSSGRDGYVMTEYIDLMTERESADYQLSLKTPMTTRMPDPTQMATAEASPTTVPTPAPTETPTAAPTPAPTEPYKGYAMTKGRTVMYDAPGGEDPLALMELNAGTLLLVLEHEYNGAVHWDYVEIESESGMNPTGFVLDDDLDYMTNDMLKQYREERDAAVTPTAEPTAVPRQKYGFARTVGDNVALRAYADTNAQIYSILAKDTVVVVNGQEYAYGEPWDLVNYASLWGYIRDDQLRMLTDGEVVTYLESLRTPTPYPEATPTAVPVTGMSTTSYGFVIKDMVNLRGGPSRTAESIRLLGKNAFALVLGTQVNASGETWYHISQSGTEGYIMSTYFKVLSVDELTAFLASEDYRNAEDNATQYSDASAKNIQALEDYNRGVWQNPAVSVSYEPFAVSTATPSPSAGAASAETPAPRSTYGIGGVAGTPSVTSGGTDVPQKTERRDSGASALGVILAGGSVVLLGSAAYIYHIHRKNERRRRAVREQQARQAARAAAYPRATRAGRADRQSGQIPSDPTRRVRSAPFMPPSGAPAGGMPGHEENGAEEDDAWRMRTRVPDRPSGETGIFTPVKGVTDAEADYDPWKKKTQVIPAKQARDGIAGYGEPSQETRVNPPVSGDGTRYDPENGNGYGNGYVNENGTEAPAGGEQPVRHRRSGRHKGTGAK